MAATIPPALKSLDITRFAVRAAQVEKAKPVVAYWCNYWIVNQILSKGLHTADDESTTYTMGLMDRLEQTKAEHSQDDAIIDDVAGQAYCEQFGLETFQRADNAVKANKATKQTADTFMAAATFLELSHIWGPLDSDIASKIKYAKYHALRIAKAFKAGEDPNASNPVTESPSEEQKPLDPNDPEVRAINGQSRTEHTQASLQPSVEEVPDEHEQLAPRLARDSSLNQSLHPSRAPSLPRSPSQNRASGSVGGPPTQKPAAENYYTSPAHPDPITSVPSADADTGYFPQVPEDHNMSDQPSLPMARSEFPTYSGGPDLPTVPVLPPPPATYSESGVPDIPRPFAHYPDQAPTHIPHQNAPTPAVPQNTQQLSLPQSNSTSTTAQAAYRTDDQSILKAQKHARWAISALNFEDVNTAVKELMGALESLGVA